MVVSLSLTVPDRWVEDFILTSDLFRYNAIGYWAVGFGHSRDGWIIVDNEGDKVSRSMVRNEVLCEAVLATRWGDSAAVASILGVDLACVHWLARKDAARVYAESVRLYGEDVAACVDASQLDVAVQRALGLINPDGKVKYG